MVPPTSCAHAITTALSSDAVYVLALRKAGGTLVGGPQRFCTSPAPFDIQGDDCSVRKYAQAGFAGTDTRGKPGYVAHIGPAGLRP
jgi:uncharacterized membrane protein